MPRKTLSLIQASRGIVPLIVLLFHTKFIATEYFGVSIPSELVRSGGVDFFFVLSGFMVFYIHYKDRGNIARLRPFIIKRFVRIYPLYWLITLTAICMYFVFPSFFGKNILDGEHIVASLLLLPSSQDPIIGVAWSLSHTVFFYCLFTLFLFCRTKITILLATLWSLIALLFSVGWIQSESIIVGFLFNLMNLEFVFGCLCAFIIMHYKIKYGKWLVILGSFLFLGTWINASFVFIKVSLMASYSIASMLLVIGFSVLDLSSDIKIPKWLNYLGNASFSIYLTHYGALNIATQLLVRLNVVKSVGIFFSIVMIVIFAVIVGCLIHTFIEKPLTLFLRARLRKLLAT